MVKRFIVVDGDRRLLQDSHAEGKGVFECGVHIGTAEVERGVAMSSDAGSVGRARALTFVISGVEHERDAAAAQHGPMEVVALGALDDRDRKSTRLNSSHPSISYAVFCLKKK